MPYTLLRDGDSFEQHYWKEFVSTKFPSYEKYWVNHIVPLTNRPNSIHFKSSKNLLSQGFKDEDICKAQLHYTALRHLVRGYEIICYLSGDHSFTDTDYLSEGLFHVAAAQDVAFEFLQRNATPGIYDAWTPKKSTSPTKQLGSWEALKQWQGVMVPIFDTNPASF